MIAMVLAAGLGTRLRPLTEAIPKPALPVLGSTLLEENLALVARLGAREVVVNAHHRAEVVAGVARRAADRLGLRLHLSFEAPEPLGTGGALVAARPLLDRGETILLLNGDVLTDMDLAPALARHRAEKPAATMVLRPMPAGADFAPVEVDAGGAVLRIAGRGREGEGNPFLFTGIHFLEPRVLDALPAEGPSCINRQGHVSLLQKGERILGHVVEEGRWSDVGTWERYREANLDLLAGRYRLPGSAAVQGVVVSPDAEVEPGARLRGPAWIGPGARVSSTAEVGPDAVVLPGARVQGRLVGEVAYPEVG
jgi:mannose-1-phosphate guanylyltransferase